MKKTQTVSLLIALVVLTLTACHKDVVTPPPAAKKPYLVSTVQNTQYGRDSFAYTYTGDVLTGMNYFSAGAIAGNYQYRYQLDSNIVWWSWNTGPNEQYSYLLTRDSSDKIRSLSWTTPLGSSINYIQYKTVFNYTGNKLSEVFYLNDPEVTGTLDTMYVYVPGYTGDDITTIVQNDYSSGSQLAAYAYSYDNTKNGFAAVNKNYWLLGYNYRNTETFDVTDAIISLSAHNIVSETSGSITKTYSYTKDPMGNIIASSGGGKFYLGYN